MNTISAAQARDMMLSVAQAVIQAKDALCDADRKIGDGDHGIGMATGFEAVREALSESEFSDVYQVFSVVGRTLIKTMGGASGIIFGLLFYGGSKNMSPKPVIDLADFATIFAGALEEIQAKGQAKVGDKTVVDALAPMVASLKVSASSGESFKEAFQKAAVAAEKGKEATKDYVAKFGKAKTLGERAIGFPDAGAVSLTVIIRAMSDWACRNM